MRGANVIKIMVDQKFSKIEKVVVNSGIGRLSAQANFKEKLLPAIINDLAAITGQKPMVTRSKKAISNFKLRENLPIGCKVTLRRKKMYEFMDRLVNVTLPRIRDFNGVSNKSFDQQGNYSIGIDEQVIFPEIDSGKISHIQGMNVTFVFNKGPKDHTLEVLGLLGVPFRKK